VRSNFDDRADELADKLWQMIEPADRFGESLVALSADMQSLTEMRPVTPAPMGNSDFSRLGKSTTETATRDGQQEQLKLIAEQLAEQKQTNEYLQRIAEKDSQDVLGP